MFGLRKELTSLKTRLQEKITCLEERVKYLENESNCNKNDHKWKSAMDMDKRAYIYCEHCYKRLEE